MSIDQGNGGAAPGWSASTADDTPAGGSPDDLADAGPRSLADYVTSVAADDDAAVLRYYAGLGRPLASGGAPPSTGGNDSGGIPQPSPDAPTVLVEDFGNASPPQAGPPSVDGFSRPGGGGGHGGGGSGGGTLTPWNSPNMSGLKFHVNWDSSVANAPSWFQNSVETALSYFYKTFASPITITLDVGYGEVGGQRLGFGALGESLSYLYPVSYGDLYSHMSAEASSQEQIDAVNSLDSSTTSPITGANYYLATADARALNFYVAPANLGSDGSDGAVGFATNSSLVKWGPTSSSTTSGQYDFVSVVQHEVSEVMGRIALLGASLSNGVTNTYSNMDLFRYDPNTGGRSLKGGEAANFSYDGTNPVQSFNTTAGGDYGDWAGTVSPTNDAYNAFSSTGPLQLGAADKTVMNVLGYTLAS